MENFDQIKIDIFDKIQKANNRNSLDSVKTEIFGKLRDKNHKRQMIGKM